MPVPSMTVSFGLSGTVQEEIRALLRQRNERRYAASSSVHSFWYLLLPVIVVAYFLAGGNALGLAFMALAFCADRIHRSLIWRHHLRKQRETLAAAAPIACTVTVTKEGYGFTDASSEQRYAWNGFEPVSELKGFLVFQSRFHGTFYIPPEAFRSAEEKNTWLDFSNERIKAAAAGGRVPSS